MLLFLERYYTSFLTSRGGTGQLESRWTCRTASITWGRAAPFFDSQRKGDVEIISDMYDVLSFVRGHTAGRAGKSDSGYAIHLVLGHPQLRTTTSNYPDYPSGRVLEHDRDSH
jgi:hypothetical protein